MYNDSQIVYETTINQNFIYYIIGAIMLLVILIITLISQIKVYKKANRSGISAIIPFYNFYILLEIVNLSKLNFILMFIPVVNLLIYVKVMFLLAKFFRKDKLFGLGLVFFPFIFYPILAFGDSEYVGINIVAMTGETSIVDSPKVVEEKNLTINEEIDEKSQKLNISIGGGVYQKDYTKDLLKVDDDKTIYNINNNSNSLEINNNKSEPSFITSVIEEEPKEEETKDISTEFQNQINGIKPLAMSVIENNVEPIVESVPVIDNSINMQFEPITAQKNKDIPVSVTKNTSDFIDCPNCGTKIKSDAKACFLCGKTIE